MANSRCSTPLGLDLQLRLDSGLISARTPGLLGRLDAGDPDVVAELGDTSGPLGIRDHGDPAAQRFKLLPPLNIKQSIEYQVFEGTVLDQHIKRAQRKRPRAADIPETELEEVEGRHKLRKKAARKCRMLLNQARIDLANEQATFLKKPKNEREEDERKMKVKGDVPVTKVERIGITSGYRSFAYDAGLWHGYFRKNYYPITYLERSSLSYWEGGEHGWKAVQSMVSFVSKRKAAPGYSNHTNGIAVDFFTVEDGKMLTAKTGPDKEMKQFNTRWERSWFYRWLQEHKSYYGIERIDTEAWHWEFHT